MQIQHLYEFDEFSLDVTEKTLSRSGIPLSITPKGFALLEVLVKNQGRILGKEELMSEIWGGSFVEEGNLTYNIRQLRKILDDDFNHPKFIETVPRRGYRFICPIENNELEIEAQPLPDLDRHRNAEKTSKIFGFARGLSPIISAGVALLIVGLASYFLFGYLNPQRTFDTIFKNTVIEKIPVEGVIKFATLSPDKKLIAYAEESEYNVNRLVVRDLELGTEKELLRVEKSRFEYFLFSPDRKFLYYSIYRNENVKSAIFRIPTVGGDTEKIAENIDSSFSVSSDGNRIAFARYDEQSTRSGTLIILDLLKREETQVYDAINGERFYDVAFSPNGTKLAVSGMFSNDLSKIDIGLINLQNGTLQMVANGSFTYIDGSVWLADASGILISGSRSNEKNKQIYKVAIPNGEIVPVTSGTLSYEYPSLSTDNTIAISKQIDRSTSVWSVDMETKEAKQIVPTNRDEILIEDTTIDNRFLISKNNENGNRSIYLSDSLDFSKAKLVTEFANYIKSSYGELIALSDCSGKQNNCFYLSNNDLWRLDVTSEKNEKLTNTPNLYKDRPFITPSERFALFNAYVDSNWSPFKLDVNTKELNPINSENTPYFHGISNTGSRISYAKYYSNADNSKNFKFYWKDIDGDNLEFTQREAKEHMFHEGHGLIASEFSSNLDKVYISPWGNNYTDVWEKNLLTGKTVKFTNFDLEKIINVKMSSDGKKLYVLRESRSDNIVIIRNAF